MVKKNLCVAAGLLAVFIFATAANAQDYYFQESYTTTPIYMAGHDSADWIIGFNEIQLPEKICPGQLVQGRADIRIKDSAKNSAGAVIYISLFGDWSPGSELARIYKGTVGMPRRISIPFSFTAPSKPGTSGILCSLP